MYKTLLSNCGVGVINGNMRITIGKLTSRHDH